MTVAVVAEGLSGEIDVGGSGQCIGDDQGWAGEVVGLDPGADAAFEVSVAREHGGGDKVSAGDGFGDWFRDRAAVADAGGAAVADGVESELFEWLGELGLVEVVGDDSATWCEAGLDPRLAAEASCDGVLSQQPGGDHHAGVAGVGATGDGGNHHGSVGD